MTPETVFTYAVPALKFGVGARNELADDLPTYDARVLLVTDPHVAASGVSGQVKDNVRSHAFEGDLSLDSMACAGVLSASVRLW